MASPSQTGSKSSNRARRYPFDDSSPIFENESPTLDLLSVEDDNNNYFNTTFSTPSVLKLLSPYSNACRNDHHECEFASTSSPLKRVEYCDYLTSTSVAKSDFAAASSTCESQNSHDRLGITDDDIRGYTDSAIMSPSLQSRVRRALLSTATAPGLEKQTAETYSQGSNDTDERNFTDHESNNVALFRNDDGKQVRMSFESYEEARETVEERRHREEEESETLAMQLLAEEAMASYVLSTGFLQQHANEYSEEDLEALQAAMAEENPQFPSLDDSNTEDEERMASSELSYETLLRLGDQIGDVKSEHWAICAKDEIQKLATTTFRRTMAEGKDENCSSVKCLVCQCSFEEDDTLRILPCKHCFHTDCVDKWLSTKDVCPYCRQSIVPEFKS